jgi:hypothetical protein
MQAVKFEFKRTNQEVTPRYRSLAPAAGSSAGGTDWVVMPGPAPTWALPPTLSGLKPCHPRAPPRPPERALSRNVWTRLPPGRAHAIGTSLTATPSITTAKLLNDVAPCWVWESSITSLYPRVMLWYFKLSFYVNSHVDKLFGKRKRMASLSPWLSLSGGMMGVRRRWKGMTAADEAPMAWCSGYGEGKMETRLSGGESDQCWDDLFLAVESGSQTI